jgi:multidrug resistance efflux pump
MSLPLRAFLPLSALALAACASVSATDEDAAPDGAAAAAAKAKPPTHTGVLVPAELEAVSLWPQAYRGELLVLEVLPQGSPVEAGDVVARLETRALDEQIRQAELDVRSAEIKHAGLVEKNKMAAQAAESKRARTTAELERARRSLEGYRTHELAFSRRSDELSQMREQHWVDDQKDELDQLQQMYEADELTDATEEIVLKRSRRDLAQTERRNALSRDQRAYQVEYTRAMQKEQREEAVQKQEEALEHLIRTQTLDAFARVDGETRSAAELETKRTQLARLQSDLELLTIRAPRGGILLHGEARDYRPGGSPPQLVRGSTLSARKDAVLVADPAVLQVALDVPESVLAKVRDGASVVVRPVAQPGVELRGALVLPTYPASRKGGESNFEGLIELSQQGRDLVVGMHVEVELNGAR